MIKNLTEVGKKKLVAHLRNMREAIAFIEGHEYCIIFADDDMFGDLYRAKLACEILDDQLRVETVQDDDNE